MKYIIKIFLLIVLLCLFIKTYLKSNMEFQYGSNLYKTNAEAVYSSKVFDFYGPTWTLFKFDKNKKLINEIFIFNKEEIEKRKFKILAYKDFISVVLGLIPRGKLKYFKEWDNLDVVRLDLRKRFT